MHSGSGWLIRSGGRSAQVRLRASSAVGAARRFRDRRRWSAATRRRIRDGFVQLRDVISGVTWRGCCCCCRSRRARVDNITEYSGRSAPQRRLSRTTLEAHVRMRYVNVKSSPSHMRPYGGADLRFCSPQPDTSLRYDTTDTEHRVVCLFTSWLLPVPNYTAW